jgi:ArsR family transcriptional regulator, arsenate/arsenite/antimonite-responsive transcriptional repressor
MEKQRYKKFLEQLKAVAEPNRLKILDLIISGVQCNCNLGDSLKMKPNLISHHISILEEAGLISLERDLVDARWVYYSINKAEMEEFNQLVNEFFNLNRVKPRIIQCGPLARDMFIDHVGVVSK